MTISNNNQKLTDIFGDAYEPGSEGTEPVSRAGKEKQERKKKETGFSLFRGTLSVDGDMWLLSIRDGGVFQLEFASPPGDQVAALKGKPVSIRGIQRGGIIADAALSTTDPGKQSSGFKHIQVNDELKKLAEAVTAFKEEFHALEGFLNARPGFRFNEKGEITREPAIIAVLEKKINLASLLPGQRLPNKYRSFDVEVIPASPAEILRYASEFKETANLLLDRVPVFEPSYLEAMTEPLTERGFLEAGRLGNGYVPPSHVQLEEVSKAMAVTCHVSPEGGWKTLKPFIDDTTDHLQVGIYDFSAPGIYASLKDLLKRGASLTIVYDGSPAAHVGKGTKVDDLEEDIIIAGLKRAGKQHFNFMKAWKGKTGICQNAYHLKVAVRDGSSFWLSSGNWQSSNQPDKDFEADLKMLKDYNREWNIVVDNPDLADIYAKFIEWDFERSSEKPESALLESVELPDMFVPVEELESSEINKLRTFPPRKFTYTRTKPLRVQSILSPDNYMEFAKSIIQSAKHTLYFQNQYIKIGQEVTEEYIDLLTTLRDKINAIDGKIILRSMFADDDRKMLEALQGLDFDMSRVKMMKNTHTKGIIADGKQILIGSHNWSNAGVQFNRDASLLIYDDSIAQYYQDVFLHDWERRAKTGIREESVIVQPSGTEASLISDGYMRLDWGEYFS